MTQVPGGHARLRHHLHDQVPRGPQTLQTAGAHLPRGQPRGACHQRAGPHSPLILRKVSLSAIVNG